MSSIVHDFAEINKRLCGDDWWKPAAPAYEASGTTGVAWRIAHGKPIPVGRSCGPTTSADVDPLVLIEMAPLPEATKRRLLDKLRKPD